MSSLSFTPDSLDFIVYAGDTYKISFEILNGDSQPYATTGSWRMQFFDKESGAAVDTDPTGVTISPEVNEDPANGVAEVTISKDLSQLFSSTASVIYEFSLVHDGRSDRYTFINGDISVITKGDI